MSIMMLVLLVAFIGAGCVTAVMINRLTQQQLPSGSPLNQDPRIAQQGERIEALENELERLRDQADFTEKLLTERSGSDPERLPGGRVEGEEADADERSLPGDSPQG